MNPEVILQTNFEACSKVLPLIPGQSDLEILRLFPGRAENRFQVEHIGALQFFSKWHRHNRCQTTRRVLPMSKSHSSGLGAGALKSAYVYESVRRSTNEAGQMFLFVARWIRRSLALFCRECLPMV